MNDPNLLQNKSAACTFNYPSGGYLKVTKGHLQVLNKVKEKVICDFHGSQLAPSDDAAEAKLGQFG